jgi:hypothetical protein
MDKYAGSASEAVPPVAVNILDVPERATTIEEVFDALEKGKAVCDLLQKQARDSATASRLATQLMIAQLITQLFTEVLPVPAPVAAAGETSQAKMKCPWSTPQSKAKQMKCAEIIHNLTLMFGTLWQAVDAPTRAFDSERAVVAACMLSMFDACIRTPAADNTTVFTELLSEDGMYSPSSTLCQNNRDLDDVASCMELVSPALTSAYYAAMEYLTTMRERCAQQLFVFRMPQQIEVKKHGSTLQVHQVCVQYHGCRCRTLCMINESLAFVYHN